MLLLVRTLVFKGLRETAQWLQLHGSFRLKSLRDSNHALHMCNNRSRAQCCLHMRWKAMIWLSLFARSSQSHIECLEPPASDIPSGSLKAQREEEREPTAAVYMSYSSWNSYKGSSFSLSAGVCHRNEHTRKGIGVATIGRMGSHLAPPPPM